jgi:hypothetical protein
MDEAACVRHFFILRIHKIHMFVVESTYQILTTVEWLDIVLSLIFSYFTKIAKN